MSLWVKSDVFAALADVRFTPESDQNCVAREMTLCAKSSTQIYFSYHRNIS
jgi:hypothetical protein